jgi:hypothetical protein
MYVFRGQYNAERLCSHRIWQSFLLGLPLSLRLPLLGKVSLGYTFRFVRARKRTQGRAGFQD